MNLIKNKNDKMIFSYNTSFKTFFMFKHFLSWNVLYKLNFTWPLLLKFSKIIMQMEDKKKILTDAEWIAVSCTPPQLMWWYCVTWLFFLTVEKRPVSVLCGRVLHHDPPVRVLWEHWRSPLVMLRQWAAKPKLHLKTRLQCPWNPRGAWIHVWSKYLLEIENNNFPLFHIPIGR